MAAGLRHFGGRFCEGLPEAAGPERNHRRSAALSPGASIVYWPRLFLPKRRSVSGSGARDALAAVGGAVSHGNGIAGAAGFCLALLRSSAAPPAAGVSVATCCMVG